MDLKHDRGIELTKGQGVAGAAWENATQGPVHTRWSPIIAPDTLMGKKKLRTEWKLNDEQIQQTSSIKWIVSTPMPYSDGDILRFAGVLNFDGLRKLSDDSVLSGAEFLLTCTRLAAEIAKLLVESNVILMGRPE